MQGIALAEVSVKPPKLPGILSSQLSSANDLFTVWDSSEGLLKKITVSQLDTRFGGGGGGGSVAWGDITGTLSLQTDLQSALNAKQNSLTTGNLTSGTSGLSVSGGSGAIIGSGVSLTVQTATNSLPGFLSASDHTTFSDSATLTAAATSTNTNSAIVRRDSSGNFSAGTITAALTGNSSTASALASNPTDCSSNQFASAIAANGDLSCSSIPNAATTATNSNTNSTIVARDGSGNFSAGTITAALSGNASTATALAANPSACSAGSYVSDIDANGTLTCSNPFTGMVESYSGHIETAANKTYVIDEYASFAKQVVNIRPKCASGTITAKLQIDGSDITTCTAISVSSSAATTTCDTGSSNNLAANGRLTLVTTSNSSCLDLTFTIKTTRD